MDWEQFDVYGVADTDFHTTDVARSGRQYIHLSIYLTRKRDESNNQYSC